MLETELNRHVVFFCLSIIPHAVGSQVSWEVCLMSLGGRAYFNETGGINSVKTWKISPLAPLSLLMGTSECRCFFQAVSAAVEQVDMVLLKCLNFSFILFFQTPLSSDIFEEDIAKTCNCFHVI